MKETLQQVAEIAQQAPGMKMAAASVGLGGVTTAVSASPDWTVYAGLTLTAAGLIIAFGSAFIGYLNMKERRRENDLKEAELNGS